jgi:hypothetical protein
LLGSGIREAVSEKLPHELTARERWEQTSVGHGKVVEVARRILKEAVVMTNRSDPAERAWFITDQLWNELRIALAAFDEAGP